MTPPHLEDDELITALNKLQSRAALNGYERDNYASAAEIAAFAEASETAFKLVPQIVEELETRRLAIDTQELTLTALREEIERMGGGCEANGGGLHSAMRQGKKWFCPDCGLMLKRVAYVLPHVKSADVRAALNEEIERKDEALEDLRLQYELWSTEDAESIDVIEAAGRYLAALNKDTPHG